MYSGIVEKLSNLAVKKKEFSQKSKLGYLASSALAGFYVGVGILMMCLCIYIFEDVSIPVVKLANGFVFTLALSLVLAAGGELFTGNVLLFSIGAMNKKVTKLDAVKTCAFSYVGNYVGALIVSLLYVGAKLPIDGMGDAILSLAMSKTHYDISALFFKGILCNILVCVAVLAYNKVENEAAKLIMVFWCILPFIALGFEHSIANMTCFTLAKIISSEFTFALAFRNLIPVTLGNIVGGWLVAFTYNLMGKKY